MLNHDYINAEHILLALTHDGKGVAAKTLESMGIALEGVRQQVEEIIDRGQQAPDGHIPFSPRAKKVLQLLMTEAVQLGHDYFGTEHILLGLILEGEGVAAQVLVELGADPKRVRQQILHLYTDPGELRSGSEDNSDPSMVSPSGLIGSRPPGRDFYGDVYEDRRESEPDRRRASEEREAREQLKSQPSEHAQASAESSAPYADVREPWFRRLFRVVGNVSSR